MALARTSARAQHAPMRLRPYLLAVLPLLAACSEPPDESPLGRECAGLLARPEQKVTQVEVKHVLLAFVGAKHGSESKHTKAEAEQLAADVLARARAGEDFDKLVKEFSYEPNDTFTITQANRGSGYVDSFQNIAFRLAPGEVGIASYHRTKSPFGWHVIKRIE